MIPRRMRLSRAHFAPSGPEKRAQSLHFSLSLKAAPGMGGCAAVISKKVAKRSVDRHRLKRRMLAILAPWCTPERVLVIYARPGALALDFASLAEELEQLLARTLPPRYTKSP